MIFSLFCTMLHLLYLFFVSSNNRQNFPSPFFSLGTAQLSSLIISYFQTEPPLRKTISPKNDFPHPPSEISYR
ncbi:hypothetical protein HOY82DRAFT_573796 [Tuber indicum]|nr:hypothetical protein HOY82DRAFT_573796 [Tuber indicum]